MSYQLAGQVGAELSITRRRGDTVYGVVSLGIFAVESLLLGILTWTFLLRLSGIAPTAWLEPVVIGCAAPAALGLLVMASFIMVQHARVERSRKREQEESESWTYRWMKVLFEDDPLPAAPLPPAAVASALDLRELLKGDEGARLAAVMRRYDVEADLLRRLGSSRLATRLEALEALAKARLPSALAELRPLIRAHQPAVRLMAARASARTLSIIPGGDTRDREVASFAEALCGAELPSGVMLEALLLLDDAAAAVTEFI